MVYFLAFLIALVVTIKSSVSGYEVFTRYILIGYQSTQVTGVTPVDAQFTSSVSQCSSQCSRRGSGCCGFVFLTSDCSQTIKTTVGKCQLLKLAIKTVVYSSPSLLTAGCKLFFADSSYSMAAVTGKHTIVFEYKYIYLLLQARSVFQSVQ
jgi:hypothetical protein